MTLSEQLLTDILDELRSGNRPAPSGGGGSTTPAGAVASFAAGVASLPFKALGTALGGVAFAVGAVTKVAESAAKGIINLADQAQNGSAGLSNLAGTVSGLLPRSLGIFGSALTLAASVTEKNLSTQQSLSQSGANFAGSLNNMRLAANASYLSLDQFSGAVTKNRDIFRTMGGNVQDGVNQFARIQKTLLTPGTETANMLATMGVSAEEAADLTASFMRSQGSMNKQDLQDSKRVAEAVGNYASELTLLSQITGKSRKELQEKMDAENAEAQWSQMLASMSPEKAEKMRQGMQTAMAQGGQGAVDAFKAMAMGMPPMTEAGRLYIATQEAGAASLEKIHQAAMDDSVSTSKAQQVNREALAKAIVGGAKDMDQMRQVLQAGGLTGSALARTLSDAQKLQTSFMKDGKMMSEKEILAKLAEIDAKNKLKKTEAAAAEDLKRSYQDLTNTVLAKIMPALTSFMTVIGKLVIAFQPVIDKLSEAFGGTLTWVSSKLGDFVKLIQDYVVPELTKGIGWIMTTFQQLFNAKNSEEFFKVLKDKAGEAFDYLLNKIIKPIWEIAKPAFIDAAKGLLGFFEEQLTKWTPAIEKFFDSLTTKIWQAIKTKMFGPEVTESTQSSYEEQNNLNKGVMTTFERASTFAAEFLEGIAGLANKDFAKRIAADRIEKDTAERQKRTGAAGELGINTAQPTPVKRAGGSLSATGKLIESFGSGTPAVLHGEEGVVTKDQMNQIISGAAQIGQQTRSSGNNTEGLEKITSMLSSALQQLAVLMKENNEYTKRNLDATRELNGNVWA